jgi:hypothetical protein
MLDVGSNASGGRQVHMIRWGTTAAVVLCAMILAVHPARADEGTSGSDDRQNELYASFGVVTLQDLAVAFESIFEDVASSVINAIVQREGGSGASYTRTTTGTHGAIGVGYNRYLSPRWTVGALFNYEGFTRTLKFSNGDQAQARDGFFALMVRTDVRWVNGNNFQLYSGLAFGGAYVHSYEVNGSESQRKVTWAAQLNLLGVHYGHSFGVFAEAGFGWNGLLAAGLSGTF